MGTDKAQQSAPQNWFTHGDAKKINTGAKEGAE
jgi:hypothetical protein